MAYKLTCTDCSFETTVDGEGNIDEVYEVIDAHQSEHQDDSMDHFVNFVATHARSHPGP